MFLSYNEISSMSTLRALDCLTGLQELTLDNNPICTSESNYRRMLCAKLSSLKKLDQKRVTDEEKRNAEKSLAKELNKQREREDLALIEEKKRLAISNAQNEWQQIQQQPQTIVLEKQHSQQSSTSSSRTQQSNDHKSKIKIVTLNDARSQSPSMNGRHNQHTPLAISSSSSSSLQSNDKDFMGNVNEDDYYTASNSRTISRSNSARVVNTSNTQSNSTPASSLTQSNSPLIASTTTTTTTPSKRTITLNGGTNILEENLMYFYGNKSLDIIDVKLESTIVNQVQLISFNYIEYDEYLCKCFSKIKLKFPNVNVSFYNNLFRTYYIRILSHFIINQIDHSKFLLKKLTLPCQVFGFF